MKSPIKKLLTTHQELTHTEHVKVVSHTQREDDDWYLNTIMLEGIEPPFKYKRKKLYKSLSGQRVNLTYYPDIELIANFEIEIMRVVRIKVS